jgi:divalent metal cation (Fe/Co/Zn/Cd) transporter
MHLLVPGEWTVQRAHDAAESIEHDIATAIPGASVFTHIEPREDPVSYQDLDLDRERPARERGDRGSAGIP